MLTRAVEQNPKDVKAYYYRALANEMVDRQAAISDWHRFEELVAEDPEAKQEVMQAQERLQVLKKMPRLPCREERRVRSGASFKCGRRAIELTSASPQLPFSWTTPTTGPDRRCA
jgi:hypothetical protein